MGTCTTTLLPSAEAAAVSCILLSSCAICGTQWGGWRANGGYAQIAQRRGAQGHGMAWLSSGIQ